MLYFILALGVLGFLSARFTPDNSNRTKIGRLLDAATDFCPTFRVEDMYNARILVMDPDASRLAFAEAGQPLRFFRFDELVAVEVVRDGMTIEKTNRGSQAMGAAVGGALLGPAGFLLGGLTGSKRHEGSIARLVLKITVNDLQRPIIDMVFLDKKAKMKMPPAKGTKIEPAEERIAAWYGRFRVILHGQQAGGAVSAPTPSSPSPVQFGRRRGLLASD